MPAAPRRTIDTTEMEIGQPQTFHTPNEGEARLVADHDIELVEGSRAVETLQGDKAALLAFMEEPVTIMVQPSSDRYAIKEVPVSVNGRQVFIPRGVDVIVKRKYVEVLARARKESFGNEEATTRTGDPTFLYPKTTGAAYDFRIVRDDNPLGHEWHKRVLREAA